MARFQEALAAAIGTLLLTTATWLLLEHQAYWEPHYVYRTTDALLYIGLAFVMMTLQLELAGVIVYAAARRRLSPWWMLTLPWLAFLFLIAAGISWGWTKDQEYFHRSLPPAIESHG